MGVHITRIRRENEKGINDATVTEISIKKEPKIRGRKIIDMRKRKGKGRAGRDRGGQLRS